MPNSSEFICKCGKQKGWIIEGAKTQPCYNCGRVYIGFYNSEKLTIEGKEIITSQAEEFNKIMEEILKYKKFNNSEITNIMILIIGILFCIIFRLLLILDPCFFMAFLGYYMISLSALIIFLKRRFQNSKLSNY